jgi:fatty acid amide hydrolase 2
MSASDLADAIRRREISPLEVVRAHIERIEEVNPRLNAVVADRFDEAVEEARVATERLVGEDPDDLGAFFGVPFTAKELLAVEGLPNTAGCVKRRDVVAEQDAPLVRYMKDAGAICVGVTNVSEAGLWLETHNTLYGRTNNAHSVNHIPGGSSGGEGAIIGAGGSPIGIGADSGGSIRNPSFFNGICGHKPSGGLLAARGHYPPADGERGRFCVSGPMARRVRDLTRAMEVLSLDDDPDRDRGRERFRRLVRIPPSEITIHYYTYDGLTQVDPELDAGVERMADALRHRGYRVEHWRPSGTSLGPFLWIGTLADSAPETLSEIINDGRKRSLLREWAKLPFGRSVHPLYALLVASFEQPISPPWMRRWVKARKDALRAEIENQLGERGVLMCLPYPRPAPRHHVPLRLPFAFAYCGLYNVLEMPATAVPIGSTAEGLPMGVQIVGRRFADALTLHVAEEIEAISGGWRLGEIESPTRAPRPKSRLDHRTLTG